MESSELFPVSFDPPIGEIILTAEQIEERVKSLAQSIEDTYSGPLLVISIINGAMIFTSDLIRLLRLPIRLDTIRIGSYGAQTTTTGKPKIISNVRLDLEGHDVLIIDDIVDTGHTLRKVMELFRAEKPKSLRTCVLLDKPSRRQVEFQADFTGFEIEDKFVVGYGLDYAENYRQLPYVGVLRPEVYS